MDPTTNPSIELAATETTAEEPATPPAAAATANGAPQGNQQRNKRQKQIHIPVSAFKSRVEIEAARIIQRRLGMPIDEAEKLVKAGGTPSGGSTVTAAANATADNALKEYEARASAAEKKANTAEKAKTEWEKKHKKDTQRLRDKLIETELKYAATAAGISDADYAVHLFAREAAKGADVQPAAYFEKLKTSHPFLFGRAQIAAPPAEVSVTPTTAPPESLQPGEKKPDPSKAGAAAGGSSADVDKMTGPEFNRHLRNYGYVPGT